MVIYHFGKTNQPSVEKMKLGYQSSEPINILRVENIRMRYFLKKHLRKQKSKQMNKVLQSEKYYYGKLAKPMFMQNQ